MALSICKEKVVESIGKVAPSREKWIKRNQYYYKHLIQFFKYNVPEGSKVLEIGCGTGYLLKHLKPAVGVGIDISPAMIEIARTRYNEYKFFIMDAEDIVLDDKFDFIIISDTIGYFEDVQKAFQEIQKLCTPKTRIIITYFNFLWLPILNLGESLGFKMPHIRNNWLNLQDIGNILDITNYDIIKDGRKFLFPVYIPLISNLLNKYIANLPIINSLCLIEFIVAKSLEYKEDLNKVSVIVPARNEEGNIESIVKRTPPMGQHTEIIFVEGNSTDGTAKEIERVCDFYSGKLDVKFFTQQGKGKADAVRKGFSMASGDVLMILDADMTVPPEDLDKFYMAMAMNKGEFINGTRLVYPMEKDAMRTLNILGNKFFSKMFTWILNQRIKDTLCGTKVISKENYQKLVLNKAYFGDFDPFGDFDLIFGSSKLNLKILEIPIRYRARTYGETNISRFKHGWILLKMTFFAMKKIKFN